MSDIRQFINIIEDTTYQLDEGVIDSIRQWIQKLSGPVKSQGQELVNQLESQLASRYNSQVAPQIKQANNSWMWSRLTYKTLYGFAIQVGGVNDAELDRILKNPVITNNLKQIFRLPSKGQANNIALPLQSNIIKNNNDYITSVVDPQTKQYLAKSIATAVLDGVAYIDQKKNDDYTRQKEREDNPVYANEPEDDNEPPPSPAANRSMSIDDMKVILQNIKQGLDKIKGTKV